VPKLVIGRRIWSDEADQFGGTCDAHLFHHVRPMDVNGLGTDVERGRDLLAGPSIEQFVKNFLLPRR
jgi:hypothetical protein